MGARYVWNRYTAVQQIGYRTRYRETTESVGTFNFDMSKGQSFAIGKSYNFSSTSGKYSTTDNSYYTFQGENGISYGGGYITATSGAMYYSSEWRETAFNQIRGKSTTKYGAESYQQQYYYYTQGSYIDQRSNASSYYYPYDDEYGGYYYVRQGSDEVDPTAVTVPDDIDDGTTITISLTPNTGKTFGGTISYTYQYRYNGGSWQTLTTTTATSTTLSVPKGQYSTLEVRVRAQDDMGFTSNTWVSSGVKTIIANQPPTAPGITVDNVYIGNELEVTLTAATDPDGTVASYVLQRRIDGGAWTQVQAGTSMTYTETVSDGWGTVAYRAAAVDNEGLQGPWATSQTFDVNPGWVIISGPESDLGDRPVPFPFEFEVGVAGHPAEDNIITQVLYDGRDLVVDRTFHDHDDIRINIDTKYYAAGVHTLQIIAAKEGYTTAMASYTFNIPAQKDELLELLESCKAEILQNPEAKAVVPFGLARFIFGEDGRDVNQMCGDGLKMAQGTYTGTGQVGSSSPNQLTFDFVPQMLIVCDNEHANPYSNRYILWIGQLGGGSNSVTISVDDKTISWYSDSSTSEQMNTSGTTYRYMALG